MESPKSPGVLEMKQGRLGRWYVKRKVVRARREESCKLPGEENLEWMDEWIHQGPG